MKMAELAENGDYLRNKGEWHENLKLGTNVTGPISPTGYWPEKVVDAKVSDVKPDEKPRRKAPSWMRKWDLRRLWVEFWESKETKTQVKFEEAKGPIVYNFGVN